MWEKQSTDRTNRFKERSISKYCIDSCQIYDYSLSVAHKWQNCCINLSQFINLLTRLQEAWSLMSCFCDALVASRIYPPKVGLDTRCVGTRFVCGISRQGGRAASSQCSYISFLDNALVSGSVRVRRPVLKPPQHTLTTSAWCCSCVWW